MTDIQIDNVWMMTDEPDDLNIDDLMMKSIEEKAAELEITVDYYMEEFM
jgi:hypothetical protein